MLITELLVILAMVLINGLFAGYEIALTSVSIARVQLLARENRPGAAAALRMKQHMESSLAAIQVGVTLTGAIAAATGGAGAIKDIAPCIQGPLGISETLARVLAIALVVLPLSIVTIVLGELAPKIYAFRNKEAVCLQLSPAMRWFAVCVWPAVWLFEGTVMSLMHWGERRWRKGPQAKKSEAAELLELRAYAAQARALRLIGKQEEDIIVRAARLSTSTSACSMSAIHSPTAWWPRTSTCTRVFPWPSGRAIRNPFSAT
jgi:putative hemolysin